jgi:two-component system nitrate/nitrite response regulator NarL
MHASATTGVTTRIRVLLVDDHQLMQWALRKFFENSDSGISLVGAAATTTDTLRLVRLTRPDVVLVALDMGRASVDLIPKLLHDRDLHVVAMAGVSDTRVSDRAVLDGARGVLRREDSIDVMVKAIKRVYAGELWLDRTSTGRIFGTLSRKGEMDANVLKIAALTRRERNIIAAFGCMASARHRKLADLLNMSEHTLRNHLSHIYAKLGLTGQLDLYVFAHRHGLVDPVLPTLATH